VTGREPIWMRALDLPVLVTSICVTTLRKDHATMPAAEPTVALQRFTLTGMTCAGCVNAVTRVLAGVPGAARVTVTLETGRAEVAGSAAPDALLAAVRKAGYGAELVAS
jgi:Cu+-exporting ATPase